MKSKKEIIKELKYTIEDVTLGNVPSDSINSTDLLIDDCGLDSLDYAVVMLQVEQRLGIKIKEDMVQWSEVRTLEQLAELFEKHQNL